MRAWGTIPRLTVELACASSKRLDSLHMCSPLDAGAPFQVPCRDPVAIDHIAFCHGEAVDAARRKCFPDPWFRSIRSAPGCRRSRAAAVRMTAHKSSAGTPLTHPLSRVADLTMAVVMSRTACACSAPPEITTNTRRTQQHGQMSRCRSGHDRLGQQSDGLGLSQRNIVGKEPGVAGRREQTAVTAGHRCFRHSASAKRRRSRRIPRSQPPAVGFPAL